MVFTCGGCGEEFQGSRPDGEAQAESYKLFGPIEADDKAVVCEDCWQELKLRYPELFEDSPDKAH